MRGLRPAWLALLAACLLALTGVLPGAAPARAAEYRLVSEANYTVRPARKEVAVTVRVTFKNITPNPPGRFSVFEVIDLAIHDGAREVRANDRRGSLRLSLDRSGGITVASVRPRSGVRYRETASFTLHYTLADGASPDVRIRPSLVIFPVWSFGTRGTVEVSLPAAYQVQLDGDQMAAEREADQWKLTSATVEDPTRWLSLVTATQPSSFATVTRSVELAGSQLEVQVRSWSDDRTWGRRTADLVSRALPLLQERLRLPIETSGALVLVESLPSSGGELSEPAPVGTDLAIGFDEAPFTIVHQLAHAWMTPGRASDRWIREGFASAAAAGVARELDLRLPYDPERLARELRADAFPLVSWGAGASSAEQDRWAYAASWHVAELLQEAVGDDQMRLAWRRFGAGLDGYAPVVAPLPADIGLPAVPADTRHLIDQLAAVSDAEVTDIFREWVLDDVSAGLLRDRSAAREAADQLAVLAGEWGTPDPVRLALAGWRFDDAQAAISEATSWLHDRDVLLAEITAAGLTAPQRLQDEYRTGGGTRTARNEIDAERELVSQYAQAHGLAHGGRSPVDQVGLLGEDDPSGMLAEAKGAFGEGDLVGSRELVRGALDRLQQAGRNGLIRIVSLVVVLAAALLGAVWLVRRRGITRAARYTAAE